jgi:hypothetical protein
MGRSKSRKHKENHTLRDITKLVFVVFLGTLLLIVLIRCPVESLERIWLGSLDRMVSFFKEDVVMVSSIVLNILLLYGRKQRLHRSNQLFDELVKGLQI